LHEEQDDDLSEHEFPDESDLDESESEDYELDEDNPAEATTRLPGWMFLTICFLLLTFAFLILRGAM
jgi:hypothetical protein